eukprot:6465925-Pyramimonas_sp.AAC.1
MKKHCFVDEQSRRTDAYSRWCLSTIKHIFRPELQDRPCLQMEVHSNNTCAPDVVLVPFPVSGYQLFAGIVPLVIARHSQRWRSNALAG